MANLNLSHRKIIHCDCDCFYAAVEMRDDPSLIDIPIAIGGSADRRGVISTCNYPARRYGVHSAMSSAQALKLCPHLKLLPGNMAKYRDTSAQIMAIYRQVTELIEPLSLDEAFLDVSDSQLFKGSATRIAEYLRQRVEKEVGITISAGVAPNKFLAKIASDWRKPNGLFVITPQQVASFVEQLPVEKIFGVGKKTAEKMHQMGVVDCSQLQQLSQQQLSERFGKFGQRLYQLSRGQDERPVSIDRVRKSLGVEHTYAEDLSNLEACLEKLPSLLLELEQRYARHSDQRSYSGLFVKVKFNDFTQTTVEQQTAEMTPELYQALLAEAFSRGKRPVRLLGVGLRLTALENSEMQQLSLAL